MKTIDANVISFNETEYYNITPEDKPFIDKILGVYLYDKNRITHCCELTPSYYLVHLYNEVYLRDNAPENLYEKYETFEGENIYVHCRQVDKNPNQVIYGEEEYEDYNETFEEIREYCVGNHLI